VQRTIVGVRLARKVASQAALAQFQVSEVRPGSEINTDDEIIASIRETGTTSYHPAGTRRMGHGLMAVVDEKLSVRGVEGLRIADASIFPTMPSSNTHVPSILAGEMAAEFALKSH
jgi:choline dehydrogenase